MIKRIRGPVRRTPMKFLSLLFPTIDMGVVDKFGKYILPNLGDNGYMNIYASNIDPR